MNPSEEQFDGFTCKGPHRVFAVFVAWRHNLDDRHDMAIRLADCYPVRLQRIDCSLRLDHMPHVRACICDRDARRAKCTGLVRYHVCFRTAGDLFGHGEVTVGQETAVQRSRDFNCPVLMEMVEAVRTDTRPVVNRHRENP